MTDPITWQALATVAGASLAAAITVQFVRVFWTSITAKAARMLSATVGLATVVTVTVASGPVDPQTVGLAVIVGLQAGLAASKLYEIGTEGLNHTTRPR